MESLKELEIVVLTRPLPEHALVEGDVGTVVHVYRRENAVEVEFVEGDGSTVAVVTLGPAEFRTMQPREILHVREYVA